MGIDRNGSPHAANLEPAEHDCDLIAPFVPALIRFDWRLAFLSARDTGEYPFIFQCFCEPASVVAMISKQPVDLWQTTEQSSCANIIADLSSGYEEV